MAVFTISKIRAHPIYTDIKNKTRKGDPYFCIPDKQSVDRGDSHFMHLIFIFIYIKRQITCRYLSPGEKKGTKRITRNAAAIKQYRHLNLPCAGVYPSAFRTVLRLSFVSTTAL